MSSNKILNCTNRAYKFSSLQYPPLDVNLITDLEQKLGLTFEKNFKKLESVVRHDWFGYFTFCNFRDSDSYSILHETQKLRSKFNLPHSYIVLAIEDGSIVLMNIINSQSSEVIWCNFFDLYNICKGKSFEYDPTIFPTFADFYEFLLDEEEKRIAEEGA